MAQTSTYLNFNRNTEEAFTFYQSVFGGEFKGGINRLGDTPPQQGMTLLDEDKNLVMHVALEITGGHMLLGTDSPESMGFTVVQGNNVHICLTPDTLDEAKRLFAALTDGGKVQMKLEKMFWGDYFASWTDKFGIHWMINIHVNE